MTFAFAYVQFCLQETGGNHRKMHPADWSCIYKMHTRVHSSNIYQLPQVTLGAPPSTPGVTNTSLVPDGPPTTLSQPLPSCHSSDAHFCRPPSGLLLGRVP